MADKIVSSDIYELSDYVNQIQSQNFNLDEETLSLGILGYLNDLFTVSIQNSVRMSAEYSNEAIPTKAKFEKNIITHALNLGIKKLNATPATMKVLLNIPEDELEKRLIDNKFRLYRDIKIFIGDFEFHFDYDIIIRKNILVDGSYVYTAMYDIVDNNELSDIVNPYFPSISLVKYYNGTKKMLIVPCTIRQVEYTKIYRKIITDNPLENKTMNFTFENQLASFSVDVYEQGKDKIHLTPVYEGLYDETPGTMYCNYSYLNSDNIRIKFDRDCYEPALNCDVYINVMETHGEEGNFKYVEDVPVDLESEYTNYDGMNIIVKPVGQMTSSGGMNKKSIEDLKRIIPKEALAHGTIINTTDLGNFFNQIDNDKCKLYFYKNRDNPLERLYYSYIIVKNNNNIIPTNTLDIALQKEQLQITEDGNLIMKPGTLIYLKPGDDYATLLPSDTTDEQKKEYNKNGFLYINPFLCILNRNPLYTSYFLDIFKVEKDLDFTYINQNSEFQFIAPVIDWSRNYFKDRDTYKMNISLLQNMPTDCGILHYESNSNKVIGADLKVIAIFYDSMDSKEYRWAEFEFVNYDMDEYIFDYELRLNTDNIYDNVNRIKLTNVKDMKTDTISYGFFKERIKCKILVFAKFEKEFGRDKYDELLPNLKGYTLCNEYSVIDKLEMFYNYSDIVNSSIKLVKAIDINDKDEIFDPENPANKLYHTISRMPLVRDRYINTEARMKTFIKEVELRRRYIQSALLQLEDSFGIDFKFFNTYGPSDLFYLEDGRKINSTNLSLTFKMKPYSLSDIYIKDNIIVDIKNYLEDINNIKDFHASVLTTKIQNKYNTQLVYFEFVDINGYGPGNQHIYMPDKYTGDVIPEFLNVNVTDEDEPDINIIIMT